MELLSVIAAGIGGVSFVFAGICLVVSARAPANEGAAAFAEFQRFMMMGGFYGWVAIHLGGLV